MTSKPFAPTKITDMTNVSSLDYDKPYSDFNYDKYINNFKQSNFVGGTMSGKTSKVDINKMIKNMFYNYKKDMKSDLKNIKTKTKMRKNMKNMRGGNGENEMFLATLKEMKDISHLEYKEPYEYSKIEPISHIPRSNFQALGKI